MTHPVAWTTGEFEARLRAKRAGYRIHHLSNPCIRADECTPKEIRVRVANRLCYRVSIPLKDATILSNCPDRATRHEWIVRIHDHGGDDAQPGGIGSWVCLDVAMGLTHDVLWSHRHLLPGVRFVVDAHVNFVHRVLWQKIVCPSLIEMLMPGIHKERLAGRLEHYPWVWSEGLTYFRSRVSLALRDVEHGLRMTLDYFHTLEQQPCALGILQFKLDILWSMLGAIQQAHAHEPSLA